MSEGALARAMSMRLPEALSLDDFDFFHLTIFDIHGISRCRAVARRRMQEVINNGLGVYSAVCYFGVLTQPNVHPDFAEKNAYGNFVLKPILSTLVPCPTVGQSKYRVAQVQCNLETLDGTLDTSTPRTAACMVLDKLEKEFGLTVKGAFEMEFLIRHADTNEDFGHSLKWCSTEALESSHEVLLDMMKFQADKGVKVDAFQAEYGPGQFEFSVDLTDGINIADKTAMFKTNAKVFLKSRSLVPIFMTRASKVGASNGYHFNHSLCTKDGKNAFVDVTQPNKLSKLGQHFLAGLIEHAPALTALCCPTINCYRRIATPWAPTCSNWGVQNRLCCFRLVITGGDNVYIENRIPTAACNPYLVLLGTLTAGMDGIRRKLPLPSPSSKPEEGKPLPRSLEEALTTLEKDTVMVNGVGEKLVHYFAYTKRTFELNEFKACGELDDTQQFEKEQTYYLNTV